MYSASQLNWAAWGFAGHSLYKALTGLRITRVAKREAIRSITETRPGPGLACCCWDASMDSINTAWVTRISGSDVERQETRYDPRKHH